MSTLSQLLHLGQNHFPISLSPNGGVKHPICHLLEHWSQSSIMVAFIDYSHMNNYYCHLSFKLVTKVRVGNSAGQKWSLGVTFHAPRSVGECEGMNPHTPKWTPTLGVRVPMDSQFFKKWFQGQNTLDWKIPYTIGKLFEHRCLKWARMTHLGI
jgi:hypothetical protein